MTIGMGVKWGDRGGVDVDREIDGAQTEGLCNGLELKLPPSHPNREHGIHVELGTLGLFIKQPSFNRW